MNVEYTLVRDLRPYPNNARTHSKKPIKQIARSIKRFQFTNPVLIDDDNQIIAGHGRVEAAKLNGMDGVPALRLSHLGEADKRAYILADNKLAEKAGWDREIVAIELQALTDVGFDLDYTGFETAEIDLLMDDVVQGGDEPDDAVPECLSGPAVSEHGDMWELGQHLLVCGDSRDVAAYELLMGRDRAQFVFTDPPYNCRIDGHVCGLGGIKHQDFAMASGEMNPEQFTAFLGRVFEMLCRYTADGSIHEVCMDWRKMREMLGAGHAHYAELKNLCIWAKTNAGMGSFYRSQHELVFVWKNGTEPHINNFELGQHGRYRTNLWTYEGVNTFRAGRQDELAMHPTVKPVALVADAIKDCSKRGSLVLDPFCGSGTILIAAERTGRRARAIEFEPRYVDVAVRRWEQYTGKTAVLCPLGETFEEAAEARRGGVAA
jgi:DNA modification methylase